MRCHRIAPLLVCLLAAGTARAQDNTDAGIKAILARAVKALGGEETLAKYHGVSAKGKGVFRLGGATLPFDGEAFVQESDRFRQDLVLGDNQANPITLVLTATKGWIKAGKTMPLPEQLESLRADVYALSLSQRPHALRDKAFRLSLIGETQVAGRPAVGVRAEQKGWPAVNLFYDKESGLPVKCEVRVKDATTAQEVSDEFFLSEYRAFNGRGYFTRVVGKRDGNDYLERELTDVRWHEALPDNLFEMP